MPARAAAEATAIAVCLKSAEPFDEEIALIVYICRDGVLVLFEKKCDRIFADPIPGIDTVVDCIVIV